MKPQRNAQHMSERDSFIKKTKEDEMAKLLTIKEDEMAKLLTILNRKNKPCY